jgi:hypothetical protein
MIKSKLILVGLFAIALVQPSFSQQTSQPPDEGAAAVAFARAMHAEAGRNLKRIYNNRVQGLCTTDVRRWGDGVVGYDRVTFVSEQELASNMLTLVHQWKTAGSQHPLLDASDFQRLRRYSVDDCGIVGSQRKVIVAVYRSGWDTYRANWATLLGK